MSEVSLSRLEKALESLKKGFKKDPSELERDGLIQRFEICVEISWKTAKKVLQENGILSDAPKNIIRELGNVGWIEDPKKWLKYLDLRNETSHIYNKEVAIKIFSSIETFIQDADDFLKMLRSKNK